MYKTAELREVGFSSFVSLDKKKRDGIKRLMFSRKIICGWITVVLYLKNSCWVLEKIDTEGFNIYDYIEVMNLRNVINFLKEKS